MNGHITLDRKLLNWEWFDDSNVVHLWIYILLRANWKEEKWHGQTINRGEFVTSFSRMSKDTGLSVQEVRTAIKKLETTGEITRRATKKQQTIIVEKYDVYQCGGGEVQHTGQQSSNKVATKKQQQMNKDNKDNKEINNIYRGSEKPIRKIVPPKREWVEEYIREKEMSIDPDYFMDYYEAREWRNKQGKVKDWQATLRTWQKNNYGGGSKRSSNPFMELLKEGAYD